MRFALATTLALLATPAFAFSVTSTDVTDGQSFPARFICTDQGGQNVSPTLNWSGLPSGTQSIAVTMHDPDAPLAGGFWHWLVVDIPASATGLAQNAGATGGAGLPTGSTPVANGAKQPAYLGPCPPAGPAHHYEITVWALPDAKSAVTPEMAAGEVGAWLKQHAIESATITPVYANAKS